MENFGDFFETDAGREMLFIFQNICVNTFRQAVEREGLVATGTMYNSIREGAIKIGKNAVELKVDYDILLRIKDMKYLNYHTVPPLNAMLDFVQNTGVDKFAYIPGYENPDSVRKHSKIREKKGSELVFNSVTSATVRRASDVSKTSVQSRASRRGAEPLSQQQKAMRIAKALQYHFRSVPNIKRGYRGIYNDELKTTIIPEIFQMLRGVAAEYATAMVYNELGIETVAETAMTNITRKMSSNNAYAAGKIDTSKLHLNFTKNKK